MQGRIHFIPAINAAKVKISKLELESQMHQDICEEGWEGLSCFCTYVFGGNDAKNIPLVDEFPENIDLHPNDKVLKQMVLQLLEDVYHLYEDAYAIELSEIHEVSVH